MRDRDPTWRLGLAALGIAAVLHLGALSIVYVASQFSHASPRIARPPTERPAERPAEGAEGKQPMSDGAGFAILGIMGLFYFLPSLVAFVRGHRNRGAILATNVLLGWTGIGWVIAAIWSFTSPPDPAVIIVER